MLVITSKFGLGRASHDHMAYIRQDGSGSTSEDGPAKATHSHIISVVVNPETQMQDTMVLPAMDGHTHALMGEIVPVGEKNELTEEERVSKVRDLFTYAKEYDKENREKARESDEFYLGKQWKPEHEQHLKASQRTSLTINLVQAAVDTLSGYQRQNRTDMKVLPTEDGDSRMAEVFTGLIKNICSSNDFEYVETDVFMDQAIAGRGYFHAYIDRETNLEGEIKIESFAWDSVWPGPHEKADWSDCLYVLKTKWYAREQLENLWPDKAEDIQKDWDDSHEGGAVHQRIDGAQYEAGNGAVEMLPGPDFVDLAKAEYRVIECEYREPKRVPVLVNALDSFTYKAEGWSSGQIKRAKSIIGFTVPYVKVERTRITTVAGNVLLEEHIREDDDFSIVPAYAKKRGNHWWGKVETVKDAQREVNKRHAQAIDIVNKMAAYGWFFDANTFANPNEEKNFRDNSTSPGFAVKVNSVANVPVQVQGAKVPQEVIALEEASVVRLREIMSVNADMLGVSQAGQSQSGVAVVNRQRQGLLGNEFLFDNLSLAKRNLGRRLIRLIQECYTPERIVRVLTSPFNRNPVMIADKPSTEYPREELAAMVQNVDATKYDLVVGEGGHSPTQLMNNFLVLLEMARTGVPVPPDMLISNAPMPKDQKDKCLQALQAQQKAAKEMQDAKMQTEMLKSMPDEIKRTVAAQHGLIPGAQPQGQGMPMARPGLPSAPGRGPQQMPMPIPGGTQMPV